MRFLWLFPQEWLSFIDQIDYMDRGLFYREAPKDKFHCVMLATQQEIGLFVLKSLPRNK